MQKWEYLRLYARHEGQGLFAIAINGALVKSKQTSINIHNFVNQLGSDGWDMVSHSIGENLAESIYFKRPIK